jgi:hypothetical protein
MIFLMAAPAPTDWAKILTWENLFPGVDEMIKIAQIPFLGIAFVMLVAHVYGSIGKTAATRGLDLAEWIRPFLMASVAAVCIANISTFTSMGINAGNDIASKVSESTGGGGANDVAGKIWNMGDQFLPSASSKQKMMDEVNVKDYSNKSAFAEAKLKRYAEVYGAPDEATSLRITSKAHRRWDVDKSVKPWDDWSEDLSDTVASFYQGISDVILFLVKAFVCGIVYVLLLVAACFIMICQIAQAAIVRLGGIMLPVFIAGVVTDYFRTQSINYIFSIIGVMLWPVGWAICLVGTVALAQAMQSTAEKGLGLMYGGVGNNGLKNALWNNVVGDAVGGVAAVFWNYLPLLFWLIVMALLLVCWVLVTMLGFPVLIQRAVTSGANVAQSAIVGAGKMALNTAGAGMVMVGMGASAAAAMKGAGGSPSSGDPGSPPGPADGGDSKALAKLGGFGDSVGDSSRGGGGGGGAGKGASGVASRRATRTTTDANGKTVTETVEEVYQSDTAPKGKDGDASPSIGAGGGGGGGGGGFAGALAQAAKNMNPLTALGRTMQNLAASDGSPESMYRVPDTGIDETRRAIAESMQAMRNNRNPPKA